MNWDQQKIDKAYDEEDRRVCQIEQQFAGNADFILQAIVRGLSVEQARKEYEDGHIGPVLRSILNDASAVRN